jgi:hypothetical protein
MTPREMIALGWERLERLLKEEGPGVHASMVGSWGVTLTAEVGHPSGWRMARIIGSLTDEQWAQGVGFCRDAHASDLDVMAAHLERKERTA